MSNKEFKAMTGEDDKLTIDDKITIKELEEKIVKMKEDKEKKCKAAKEQLIETLKVTYDKYRTATGVAEALRVFRFIAGDDFSDLSAAQNMANDMAGVVSEMVGAAETLPYSEMDKICENFYDENFVDRSITASDLVFELMCIDLCRNVGPAAEDMVDFIKRVEEEIDATGRELKKLKAKEA